MAVDPFEYGPWNVVCRQCHTRRPPIYYAKELPELCQCCVRDNSVAADEALREGNIELLRKELITEQQRSRDIERELTQIKAQVHKFY